MQADFWHDKWVKGATGFHLSEVNHNLIEHWSALEPTGNESVLVPLCGKSLDMIWLAQQGYNVIGVELVQQAVEEFLSENALQAEPLQAENHKLYQLPSLALWCGDFFKVAPQQVEEVSLVYDRAALVALPAPMRKQYVEHIQNLLPKGTKILLVTMEYDQDKLQGPPFSVVEDEVNELYGFAKSVTKLQQAVTGLKGLDVVEKVYLIEL